MSQPQTDASPYRKVPELLAPAGGRPQFFAALNAGADAVYLGLKAFNARARAENFTVEDLRELVPLARAHRMKVLVTVNVLVKETELESLVDTLSALEDIGVDAIIVQDLAVARIVTRHFPALRLHASTQMAVHNLAGVLEAARAGFRRVVLARELTAKEIRAIRDAVPEDEVELEAFCHGSLCYSYSGLCFFSGAADSRSGNRGECAYTCRVPYKIVSEPGHGFLFSMRDLDTSDELGELVSTGVDTLKIEGRKKDPQYVSTVVRLYRSRLDEIFGRPTLRDEAPAEAKRQLTLRQIRDDLALTYQRNPTTFFLKGRYHENVIDLDNPTHKGVRVGEIRRVGKGSIVVRTEVPLERFDGLRVVPSEQVYHALPQHGVRTTGTTEGMLKRFANEQPEFSLRDMTINGRWAATAPSATTVEIAWPDDKPLPRHGDVLYKIRSADLKRRVLRLESPPEGERLRPLRFVDADVTLEERGEQLSLRARLSRFGHPLTEAELTLERQPARKPVDLGEELGQTLRLFGDEGFATQALGIDASTDGWFIPRSKLKELKQQLAVGLEERYTALIASRRDSALQSLGRKHPAAPARRASFAVKTDRLETVRDVVAHAGRTGLRLDEIVFEPKRAFLPGMRAEAAVRELIAAAGEWSDRLRLALPTVIRAWDEHYVKQWLVAAAELGLRRYEVGNIGALNLLEQWGLQPAGDMASDFTLYALNSQATRFWAERGVSRVALSIEDDLTNLRTHLARWPWEANVRPQAILFKDTPLFIAEACSLTALHNGCPTGKVCGYRTLEIENPAGERFFVAHESCKSIVYGKEAYSIAHRRQTLQELGISDFRVDFLTRRYESSTVAAVLNAAWNGAALEGTHTANFERTLL